MASRDLRDLCPKMQEKALQFQGECKKAGLDVVIICTYRPNSEQDECFARGASACRGGQSRHNAIDNMNRPASEAFDVGVIRNGKYIGDGRDPDYTKAGLIGESLGLIWAGRWRGKIREVAHFELARES